MALLADDLETWLHPFYFFIFVYSSGDGQDTILDTDGLGKIVFNGVTLAGGVRLALGEYISGDKQFRYVFHGDLTTGGRLAINDDLRIEHFKNDDLGISLSATQTDLGVLYTGRGDASYDDWRAA